MTIFVTCTCAHYNTVFEYSRLIGSGGYCLHEFSRFIYVFILGGFVCILLCIKVLPAILLHIGYFVYMLLCIGV